MPLPPPTISAILVTWNRCERLLAAIDSLVRQEYLYLEIVVVDNNSVDDTEAALAKLPFPVRYLRNSRNFGACVARNQGVRVSGGELLLFMDSDAELLTENALLSLARQFSQDPNLAGASGVIYSDRDMRHLWCWSPCMDSEGFHDPQASVSPQEQVTILSTCFSIFRRDIFFRVGGFDPYYFYLYEDADLSARIQAEGHRFFVDPNIGILHHYDDRGRVERNLVQYHRYHERLRLYYLLKICGLRAWGGSLARFLCHPRRTHARFPYLSRGRWLEVYAWRPFLQILTLPTLRWRRKRDWIADSATPARIDVLGGVSDAP